MTSSELNYVPEILDMVEDMRNAVKQVDQEMDDLTKVVKSLFGNSKSQIVNSFNAVHQQCATLMQNHTTTLNGVAAAIGQGYNDMISYDATVGRQIENA